MKNRRFMKDKFFYYRDSKRFGASGGNVMSGKIYSEGSTLFFEDQNGTKECLKDTIERTVEKFKNFDKEKKKMQDFMDTGEEPILDHITEITLEDLEHIVAHGDLNVLEKNEEFLENISKKENNGKWYDLLGNIYETPEDSILMKVWEQIDVNVIRSNSGDCYKFGENV